MEHWTDKYERARKAGAWILASEAKHGRPNVWHSVGGPNKAPAYGCSESDYTIVWPAGVVEEAVESFRGSLKSWQMAYPEQCFSPPTPDELRWLKETRPGLLDRISADMGRHVAKCLASDFAALSPFTSEVGK